VILIRFINASYFSVGDNARNSSALFRSMDSSVGYNLGAFFIAYQRYR
jgi:hypothetical protein